MKTLLTKKLKHGIGNFTNICSRSFLLLMIISSLFFISSCSKENEESISSVSYSSLDIKGLSFENGYLVFSDESSFQETVKFLLLHQDDLSDFYNAFP